MLKSIESTRYNGVTGCSQSELSSTVVPHFADSGLIKKCTCHLDGMEIKPYVISIYLRQKRVNLLQTL